MRKEVQGQRPTPLKIFKGSRSITKSSTSPLMAQRRKPVIIYLRSPKVIHTQPEDFMALVQRLTGSSHTTTSHCNQNSIAAGSSHRLHSCENLSSLHDQINEDLGSNVCLPAKSEFMENAQTANNSALPDMELYEDLWPPLFPDLATTSQITPKEYSASYALRRDSSICSPLQEVVMLSDPIFNSPAKHNISMFSLSPIEIDLFNVRLPEHQ
eukprot:Gb_08510 [translate_table: standard]